MEKYKISAILEHHLLIHCTESYIMRRRQNYC